MRTPSESGKSRGGQHGKQAPRFVDAFAGCGGLSLGLKRAGWTGVFAIEKDRFGVRDA